MIFNSYFFIFFFLPVTLFLFFSAARYSHRAALSMLFCASLVFYGWWDYTNVLLLLFSIIINYFIGLCIVDSHSLLRKIYLWIGIIFNLGLLGYYKYADFFLQNINTVFYTHFPVLNIVLPIGISFFTFTQLAFLIDSYRGLVVKYNFLNYSLFVTYFPHLVAGPIIHHKEVMPQFEKSRTFQFNYRSFLLGLTLFAIGLFKKVFLADYLGYFVNFIFDSHTSHINSIDAWTASLAYTFELYFDFSGYSDMALGLSLLIGIKLPINFFSPYKAHNIIEFWRRWNITLSRFLRDYLYFSLGGNRKGRVKRYLNLMITMILGGLWHGASWTFVMWGFLHGIYLCINHGWISFKKSIGLKPTKHFLSINVARALTFLVVVVAWVFFRSPDLVTANKILHSMFSINIFSGEQPVVATYTSTSLIFISFAICWSLPNSYQFLARYKPALLDNLDFHRSQSKIMVWKPTLLWNTLVAMAFVFGVIFIQASSTFLYFRF